MSLIPTLRQWFLVVARTFFPFHPRAHLGVPDLNLSSPNQLLSALRSAGLDLKSTRENELKAADDGRIIPLILQYRAAEKRAQQAESLIEPVKSDGRIHARFEPTGTMTGRFSSKEPNLQNVGRGELREAFVPAPGHRFIVADYSQVELRAAAAIAGETKMIEAYREGADLHTRTASTVLGADPASISKEQRQTAKAVSFGLLYGQSVPGLMRYAASSYGVALQDDDARRTLQTYWLRHFKPMCASVSFLLSASRLEFCTILTIRRNIASHWSFSSRRQLYPF